MTLCLAFLAIGIFGQSQEDIVKAAYIEKLTHHIVWPSLENDNDSGNFVILVVGDQTFYELIKGAYDKRTLKGKQVHIFEKAKLSGDEQADIIFLGVEKTEHIRMAKLACLKYPCLILSEFDDFASEGVHINFYITRDSTVHFEMNKLAMDKVGFKPDFLLVEFAKIVNN